MRTLKIILFAAALILAAQSCGQKKEAPQGITQDQVDSLSYSLGVIIGSQFKDSKLTYLNMAEYERAIEDVMADKTLKIEVMNAQMFLQNYFTRLQEMESARNLEEGQKFLAENKEKEGVIETPSGLQYKIITEGTGPMATAIDTVEVHYIGTLIDGTEFDSSHKNGQTATFPLTGVIQGWIEGLQLIPEGSTVMFYIPSELAYGNRQASREILPNSTLIFEIELIKVKQAVEKK
ncbi:MAG: FKBP-type peptidyl-prolyl cis-trans isomerase [Bacteroidales bacterium]|nr:FKBP-type peptidyl-prolyl cis-trans isomerase [Bacteroidales bacterium]MCL2133614.1 FKBP-type peptidyl-prolyl cis-trans isomerase [Bacteroidales bacterium]